MTRMSQFPWRKVPQRPPASGGEARRPAGRIALRALPVAVLLLLAGPAVAADDDDGTAIDDRPHVTMQGTAAAEVAPDLAILRLGVVSENVDAAAAARASRATLDAVIEAAKAQGVAAGDIVPETTDLVSLPGQDPARSFAARSTIRLRCHDPARAGALLQALIAKGANRVEAVTYTLDDPEAVLARLTGAAVTAARRRADGAAVAANVRLGPVLQIETPEAPAAPVWMPSDIVAMTSSPERATYSVTVEVTFAIQP